MDYENRGAKLKFSRSQIFFYVFAVIIFGFSVFYFSEIKNDLALFAKIKPFWILLALVAQLGTYFFSSLVYRDLLKIFKIRPVLGIRELIEASVVVLFINQIIPSASLSGNIFFSRFLERREVSRHDAFSVIVLELLTSYLAVLGIILLILLYSFFRGGIPEFFAPILLTGLLVYAIFSLLAGLVGNKHAVVFIVKKLSHIPFLRKSMKSYEAMPFEEIKSPWHVLREHTSTLASIIFFQLCVSLCDSFTLFVLFLGLNLSVPFFLVLVGLILTRIVSLLPISPGSLILYEGSMTVFYAALGVPVAVAAIVTLLYRALSFWLPIPVGFFLYRKMDRP